MNSLLKNVDNISRIQTHTHTHIHMNSNFLVAMISVGLAQAHTNYMYYEQWYILIQLYSLSLAFGIIGKVIGMEHSSLLSPCPRQLIHGRLCVHTEQAIEVIGSCLLFQFLQQLQLLPATVWQTRQAQGDIRGTEAAVHVWNRQWAGHLQRMRRGSSPSLWSRLDWTW